MPVTSAEEQLVAYLADAHSIEEQALIQMRFAPRLAGDPELAQAFREHRAETERHERIVRGRLEAHGADPSRMKDLAGKAGGAGMLIFAGAQPDTPGKLAAHAFSYEHMELAAYELLERAATSVGDNQTAAAARAIAGEERQMAERLERSFDRAARASLRDLTPQHLSVQLDKHLADAHAIEHQSLELLETAPQLVQDEGLAEIFSEHLEETREHESRVAARLEARGASPSRLKDLALRAGALNLGAFFGAQPDTEAKLAGFAFAFEHLEIAAYELLERIAAQAEAEEAVALAEQHRAEERSAAERIASTWERTMGRAIAAKRVG